MALANVRIKITYGTRVLGIGTSYFVDASRNPIVMERRGGKFVLGFDVMISEEDQDAFNAARADLEESFDEAASPALALRIETDSVLYHHFDPAGACSFKIIDFDQLGGKICTVTANGVDYVLTEGVDFNATTSNAATAVALAAAINATNDLKDLVRAATFASPADDDCRVFLQSTSPETYSIDVDTDASDTEATATNAGITGSNARPRIGKPGVLEDTARSRRYAISIELDLPASQSGKDGRLEEKIEIVETDSRQKIIRLSGVYTALGASTALEQYDASVDDWADDIQDAVGGSFEGPFEVVAAPDGRYAFNTTSGGRKLGRVVRFSRTYQELIYARSLADDVRLRRAMLKVSPVMEAPGDYGPGGKAVFRMRSIRVAYEAAVDKTSTQNLKAIYTSVVKPFLEAEARKVIDGEQLALVQEAPELDRTKNRVSVQLEYLAARGNVVESTVTTQDEDDQGKQLVAVWDGDNYSKQEYQGPKTLRRTVTQSYTILTTAAAAAQGSEASGMGAGSWLVVKESSPVEQALDDFFFGAIATGSAVKFTGGENDFPTSGGVPEPSGFKRVFRNGVITTRPVDIGRPGEPQIKAVIMTKVKVYEYIHEPALPSGGPGKTPSPGAGGGDHSGTSVATGTAGGSLR